MYIDQWPFWVHRVLKHYYDTICSIIRKYESMPVRMLRLITNYILFFFTFKNLIKIIFVVGKYQYYYQWNLSWKNQIKWIKVRILGKTNAVKLLEFKKGWLVLYTHNGIALQRPYSRYRISRLQQSKATRGQRPACGSRKYLLRPSKYIS
jgi:hypothetical protein